MILIYIVFVCREVESFDLSKKSQISKEIELVHKKNLNSWYLVDKKKRSNLKNIRYQRFKQKTTKEKDNIFKINRRKVKSTANEKKAEDWKIN